MTQALPLSQCRDLLHYALSRVLHVRDARDVPDDLLRSVTDPGPTGLAMLMADHADRPCSAIVELSRVNPALETDEVRDWSVVGDLGDAVYDFENARAVHVRGAVRPCAPVTAFTACSPLITLWYPSTQFLVEPYDCTRPVRVKVMYMPPSLRRFRIDATFCDRLHTCFFDQSLRHVPVPTCVDTLDLACGSSNTSR